MHGTALDPIIAEAREHLVAAKAIGLPAIEPGRWEGIYDKQYDELLKLSTVAEVLEYAQRQLPFTYRVPSTAELIALYYGLLFCEFREYQEQIEQFSDDPRCFDLWHKGDNVVSNIFYWHLRSVIFCMHHVGPQRILDIGGGFGSVARLFLKIEHVSRYAILDLPESLFFAEVCLRSEGHEVSYYDGTTIPTSRVVLIPAQSKGYTDRFDLVLNIGSLQEMSPVWVGQYMAMLDGPGPNYFYSLNYGAQPLERLVETRNWWSCCPGPQWRAQVIAAEIPLVKTMCQNRDFAEHLYVRAPSARKASDWRNYRERKMTRQVFLECLDCLRYDGGDFAETAEFVRALMAAEPEHKKLYKELIALAYRAGLEDIAKGLIGHSGGLMP